MSDADRRQLLHLDAVRSGASESADPDGAVWKAAWASSTDLDPRLILKLHVGRVETVAWGEVDGRPMMAVCTHDQDEADVRAAYQLRLWDVLDGRSRDLPCTERARCFAFATTPDGPVLISGHEDGRLRIWDVADASLRKVVKTGRNGLRDLYVAESRRRTRLVTRDSRGRVQLWSFPDGERAGELDVPVAYTMRGGRLVNGKHVLMTAGHGLSLWNLDRDKRLRLRLPQEAGRIKEIVLFTSDGRDRVALLDESHKIFTYDLVTGTPLNPPITAHQSSWRDGLTQLWLGPKYRAELFAVSGMLPVPTQHRVHLRDLATSKERGLPLTGPAAYSTVQRVRWQGRELLLTASAHDGVVALWDLGRPVTRAPGHEEHVVDASLSDDADVVASVDAVGTVVARRASSGRLVGTPLATEILHTRTVAVWTFGRDVFATTTAGSHQISDNRLRQWNLVTGVQQPPVEVATSYVQCLGRVRVNSEDVLVTFDPGRKIRLWHPADGVLLAETMTGLMSYASGFATGIDGDRPVVALSDGVRPLELYTLDDLKAAPVTIPEAGDGSVLDVDGPFVVTGQRHRQYGPLRTVRVWNVSGDRFGPDVRGTADITGAKVREWPVAYIGRADGTVSLTDLETGEDLCRPLLLPTRPNTLTVTGDGDLIVGFGSDLARFRPPIR